MITVRISQKCQTVNGARKSLFLLKLSRIRVLNNKHCPKAKSNQEMTFYTNAKPIEDYLQKMAL